jgi:hypothetical protein
MLCSQLLLSQTTRADASGVIFATRRHDLSLNVAILVTAMIGSVDCQEKKRKLLPPLEPLDFSFR